MKMMKLFKIIAVALAFTAAPVAHAQSCGRLVDDGYWLVSHTTHDGRLSESPVITWVENWELDSSECTPGEEGGGSFYSSYAYYDIKWSEDGPECIKLKQAAAKDNCG
jgi:hypothetical protein